MKFYITDKKEYRDLSITDRDTNVEWTADLLGNNGDLRYNIDEERYELTEDDYEWWDQRIRELNEINDLIREASYFLSDEEYETLIRTLNEEGDANDLEYSNEIQLRILRSLLKKDENIN